MSFSLVSRVVVLMGILGVLGGGCAYVPKAPEQSGDAITFIMMDRNPEALRFALYTLDSKGTLSGGGGLSARNEKVDWTIALGPEDVSRLDTAIRDAGWLNGEAIGEPDGASGPRVLAISIRGPNGNQALTIEAKGDAFGPQTSAVLKLLVKYASRRYSQKLNALPQAGDSLNSP